ncbi:MAG: Flp family type IVb pilin [Nitratireductor sp.]|nr:Flp family type IVb pilin [Nitratireductor sp.]MCC0021158.1 Flp family type IVb pilin [Nitratireductor sp.]
MLRYLRTFLNATGGATSIEYSVIAGLIALAIISGITQIGNSTIVQLEGIAEHMK